MTEPLQSFPCDPRNFVGFCIDNPYIRSLTGGSHHMHSGESLAAATAASIAEVELVRARMRVTLGMIDRLLADHRHLHVVPDAPESAGVTPLFESLGDDAEGVCQ